MPSVVQAAAKCVTTDMKITDILALAQQIKGNNNGEMTLYSAMLPSITGYVDGVSYVFADEDALAKMMKIVESGGDPSGITGSTSKLAQERMASSSSTGTSSSGSSSGSGVYSGNDLTRSDSSSTYNSGSSYGYSSGYSSGYTYDSGTSSSGYSDSYSYSGSGTSGSSGTGTTTTDTTQNYATTPSYTTGNADGGGATGSAGGY